MTGAGQAAEQRALWSAAPRDWAEIAEPQNEPLFAAVLDAAAVGAGTRLLDVACGSGYAARMAARRGARVAGVDVTPELLAIARERVPDGDLREADMAALPFADGAFDVVTGFNAFAFAADPPAAIAEAARVLAPGGRLAVAGFAEPEHNEGTVLHLAMKALVAEAEPDGYAPYSLSDPGALEAALREAGLAPAGEREVALDWSYPDEQTALRAL
ncbi:MAG TPA: methyltransferase domain-containing protein, partial [Solirubrobacteraceae bacterium]|nr:methyltransferase domain-containing protein [Solirubrobacteraceae bacterium]